MFDIKRSLPRKGNPYDNAVVESTNRLLRKELVYRNHYTVYGQINVYGVTTKSERHKRSYWTRTADGNGIGGRKAPVPYGS